MRFRRFFIWSLLSLISGLGTCKQCTSSDYDNILQKNKSYTYRFRSEALVQAVGTTEDHSRISIECDAHVTHDRACFYYLDLQECLVTATGGQPGQQKAWIDGKPLPELSKYPIAFSLEGGEIKEVKTHEEDPLYYVNIKRGVLSAFVFKFSQTEDEIHESHTDIHGTCPLISIPDEKLATVNTQKDMLHCSFPSRPDWQLSPWSVFWNMSFIQHVINSTTDCQYKIDGDEKRIEEVLCKERHAIMLESTHKTTTAVQTNVNYYMYFINSEVQSSKPAFPILTRKTDIRYEYEDTPVPQSSPRNFLPIAEKMLSDLVLDSVDEIRLFTISQFTDFVAWLRSSHNIRPLVDSVKSCAFLPEGVECNSHIKDLAYSYLSDALLQCNNLPCVKALTYLAMKDDLSPMHLNFIYQSWSYMHYSKPGFITNFVDLCRMQKSHQCWMALGSFIHRVYSRDHNLHEMVQEEAREVVNGFHSRISEECEVAPDKVYIDCLIFLKAASNMGKYYTQLESEGINQLLELATNENSPIAVRTSALEALNDVCDTDVRDERLLIYDKLLPLLKNETLAPSVRILSYDQIIHVLEDHSFAEHLLSLLKDGKNDEVKYYVASSLNALMTDLSFRSRKDVFLKSLKELLYENHLSLEGILYETKGKSKSSSQSFSLNFPFMPDYMKRFGLKIKDSYIYDSYIYPSIFNQKTILQLFSTYLPASKLGSYFEGFEELILAYQKNLNEMDGKPVSWKKICDAVIRTLDEYRNGILNEGSLRNFDEGILTNVKKLHQLYWQHHKKLNPFAKAYLDLFGSTVKYFIHDSLQSESSTKGLDKLMQSMANEDLFAAAFNTTRVIRVIEAYHQVPTMMGLPLNWTTNATLALSLRTGFESEFISDVTHYRVLLRPSAALTFLNRMVLDFPTLTQIGVQANSSGYTSTDFKAEYALAKDRKTLRFERPSRTQKVLELFRTNQLIKHNKYEDIPDWDIERTSSSSCTKDDVNSAVGLKFCISKSYPNVTHRIKPWALMAGWCKWQFLIHPTNEKEIFYEFDLQQDLKQKKKEYNAKFSVTEDSKEKAGHFKAIIDETGKDLKLELKTTILPDFSASLRKSELTKNKKVTGHKIEGVLKLFKDFKYEMEFSKEGRIEKPSTKTSSPPDENSQTLVNEENLSVKSPYSVYAWNKKVLTIGENVKAEASLSYENLKDKSDWMKKILPPAFWEDDKKASFKAKLHWKKPIHNSQGDVTRLTEFKLQVPRFIMSLTGDSRESKNRHQMLVSLARIDVNHGKLDAFLNFSYDWWSNENKEAYDKDIGIVNITIPRRSWSIMYQVIREGAKYQHELKMKRALMKPINELKSDYVGWWSNELIDRFRIEEQEIKLIADNEMLSLSKDELTNKYSTVTSEDLDGLSSSLLVSNIVLQFPFNSVKESVIFDGYFILSSGRAAFRFQKNFDLISSYNNLKLTSHSVYRAASESTTLYHSSYFTHLPSETKAYNTIHFTSKKPRGKCIQIAFLHDIRSHVFDLTTDATYRCETEEDNLHVLRLTLNTNSSKWNMLDIKLDQIIEDISSEYTREEMTTYHATGTIHVDAEWQTNPRHSQKRVTLCSQDGNCPNAELFLENFHDGKRMIKFSLPNRNETEISYERKLSSDSKNVHVKIGYFNNQDGLSELLDFTGELIARNYHVWKGTVNANSFTKVKELFLTGYETARKAYVEIATNKNHPLNEMLQPALKMTLYEYSESLKVQFKNFLSASWDEIMEVFYTVEAFTEPAYAVLINSITNINDICRVAYDYVKEKSVTIWAINYFQLPYYFQQGFMNLPHGLSELWNQLTLGEENILHFKFVTGKLVTLTTFLEWPLIQFDPSKLKSIISYESEDGARYKNNPGQKIAMIFGPLHVYTFDGHLYEAPKYPQKDCTFLLAHDVHRLLFSVFSSEKGIHILFPEMSVTINDQNEVFINGNQEPSSLPLQARNGKVTVKRSHVVEVWSPSLSVICRSEDYLCILKLSEYHTGGVIGLLGNADEYSTNDFTLPTGNTSSLLQFAKTYEISGKEECKNLVLSSLPTPSEEETQACIEEFEDVCYSQSHIRERFLEACISNVRAGHGSCYSAAGLSALCNLKYTPSHSKCNVKKQEKETISRSLEVVLIVHQTKYLTSQDKANSPVKGMESLVKALDKKFKDAGYENVQYSLVGFGGNEVHYAPHVHSSKKDIWLSGDAMIDDVLKRLEFKSREDADPVQALKYALEELGHDSFDSKVFVVITAKDKQVANKPVLDLIQRQLDENGITLYTFSSYPSIEKGKKVFGVRADGLIFPSQTKDGDAYLDYPRGNLAKLTSSTRGSVFLSKFLRENKPSDFFAEFAQEVWAKVNKEAQKCRYCTSVRGGWWWFKNECRIVQC